MLNVSTLAIVSCWLSALSRLAQTRKKWRRRLVTIYADPRSDERQGAPEKGWALFLIVRLAASAGETTDSHFRASRNVQAQTLQIPRKFPAFSLDTVTLD